MSSPSNKEGNKESCPADSLAELCDEREAARRLGLSVATLRRRRLRRQPPVWAKLGSRVLYRKQDLESFIEANVVRLPDSGTGNLQ